MSIRRRRTATTDEGLEQQLVSDAMELAGKQLREGTASSQVMTHFLKMGSEREKLERDRLRGENELLRSKVDAMASAKRVEELYAEALEAMRTYAGQESKQDTEEYPEEEYYYD